MKNSYSRIYEIMKLLYITNGINGSGGLERVLSVKASALAEDYEYEVHMMVLNNAHQHPFYRFSAKLHFHSIAVQGGMWRYWTSYQKGIQRLVDEVQPDVISVCDDGLKGFFLPSIIRTKASWIYERHASIRLNTDASVKGKLLQFLMKRQVRRFDRFVVLTKGNVAEWNKPNVVVIPNPLSFESCSANPLDQKRVVAVGSHSWNKGYDRLIMAWKRIEAQHPDWRVDIFGKADEEQTFVTMARDNGVERICFHSPVANIQSEYEQSSIMVLPSRSEGFGMVLIEAMACGVPCVAFDCPSGPADIITDGEDGFLVQNGAVDAFGDFLSQLMDSLELRQAMGSKAKENVQRYNVASVMEHWLYLFNTILKK